MVAPTFDMEESDFLDEYFELCKRVFLQMGQEGFPWEEPKPNAENQTTEEEAN